MASDRKAIRRLMQRIKIRKLKRPGFDADFMGETASKEGALRLLLTLPDEASFVEEFTRFMIDCGLQVGKREIASARLLWRSYH
jgi:hypothetical protein